MVGRRPGNNLDPMSITTAQERPPAANHSTKGDYSSRDLCSARDLIVLIRRAVCGGLGDLSITALAPGRPKAGEGAPDPRRAVPAKPTTEPFELGEAANHRGVSGVFCRTILEVQAADQRPSRPTLALHGEYPAVAPAKATPRIVSDIVRQERRNFRSPPYRAAVLVSGVNIPRFRLRAARQRFAANRFGSPRAHLDGCAWWVTATRAVSRETPAEGRRVSTAGTSRREPEGLDFRFSAPEVDEKACGQSRPPADRLHVQESPKPRVSFSRPRHGDDTLSSSE
jgi:hypothetical protein